MKLSNRTIGTWLFIGMFAALSACSWQGQGAAVVMREDAPGLTEHYARFRSQQLRSPRYELSVELAEDSFSAQARLSFELLPGNRSPLTIDFEQGEIQRLQLNGRPVPWERGQGFISIAAAELRSGQNQIEIDYRRPYATDGDGLHRFVDPENADIYLYTNFEPYAANRWFPHFDQPDLKAPLTLDVKAPADWQVIANTRETRIDSLGDQDHWHFPTTALLPSYVYALHAGPYHVWESQAGEIPLRLFARRALVPYVDTSDWFEPTQRSFAFFQDYFDMPYPFGKYDQVIVPDFNAGAMENVGAVTFSERFVPRGEMSNTLARSLANVIAHEMAHMWFGNLVTMDWWNGLWLNESFATYMADLALDSSGGYDFIWDDFYLRYKLSAYRADQQVTTHPVELPVRDTYEAFANFDAITYGKGGAVLKQLPYLLGEDSFRDGVRLYLQRHAYDNTQMEDFVNALATASGMNMNRWRNEWLQYSGVNIVRAEFACEAGKVSSFGLRQLPPAQPAADSLLRRQRTQVGFYRYEQGEMRRSSTVAMTYAGEFTAMDMARGLPCPDLVLPNEGDWAYMQIQLDERSRETLLQHIDRFYYPSVRMMLWQALWEEVERGELPLSALVDTLLIHTAEEKDDRVLRHVTGLLTESAALLAVAGQDQAPLRLRMESFAQRQLEEAAPGGEAQRLWFDAFVELSHSDEALDTLSSWLDWPGLLPGFDMNQDRRWQLIVHLNRHAHPRGVERLALERQRDRSDQGQTQASIAQAVRPEAEIKARWLQTLASADEEVKLATLRQVMSAMFPPEQQALLAAFQTDILTLAPQLNARQDSRYLRAFLNLQPALCNADSVERLDRATADFAQFDPSLVKAYRVLHQRDAQCTRILQQLL